VTKRIGERGASKPATGPRFERAPRSRQRAWRTLAPVWATKEESALSPAFVERLRPLDRHTDRNSDAEYAFYRLSSRFQRFAEEYLFADERILAFVPWSATATETWRHRFGRLIALGGRIPLEGALVVTDRQVFMIRDAAEAAGGGLAWGYAVQATTPERLLDAQSAVDNRGRVELHLALTGVGGIESVAWIFPPAARDEVERVVTLLSGFLPREEDRRLRRVGRIVSPDGLDLPPGESGPRRVSDWAVEGERNRLEATLARQLTARPDPCGVRRHVHAKALIPQAKDRMDLLAITQAEIVHLSATEPEVARSWQISGVTTVELLASVLGWHVSWTAPNVEGEPRPTVVSFPTIAAADCLDVFAALRQALTLLPIEAAGPELPPDDTRRTGEEAESQ
jgi:hypothetical protein